MIRGVLLSSLLLLSSCSVYKSAVRGDFENRAPSKLVSAAALGECAELGPLPAWIEKEFPGAAFEVLISEPDLEVWKRSHDEGWIEIRSFRGGRSGTTACRQYFENEAAWEKVRNDYFELLDSNPLD